MPLEYIAWAGLIVALVAAFFTALQWASAYRSAAEAKRSADAAETLVQEAERTRLSQAEAMKAQAKHTEAALESARQTANAAERLAESNEALAIAGQRGWFIVMDASAGPDHAMSKVIVRAHFHFRNVGKTPIAKLYLRRCEKLLAVDPKDYRGLTLQRYPTVGPNTDILVDPIYECTPQEFSKVKSGELKVYFYGNAMYNDIFGYSHGITWQWEFDGNNLSASDKGNDFKGPHE